jgi:2,5-diamino-6-(ribosylamino)-4(3H)-pyrimidinone 5'-phosphate reductase
MAAAMDSDHEMEDRSEADEESKGDIQFDEGDSHLNGQDVAESSTPTNYSLYDLPPRLATLRQQIHDLEHQIELPKVDWEALVPWMDNVWRKLKSSEQTETSHNVELYWCKLKKPSNVKAHHPRPTPEGKQARKRKPKEEKACNMAMKVTYSTGALDKVTIQKYNASDTHSHDLDFMDAQKRNTGIMNTARREAVKGFQPASIWWKMQTEPDKLDAAGGKYMKISDVRNVQYQWRQEHPDAQLKAHTGYNAARTTPARPAQPAAVTRQKSSPRNVVTQLVQPQPRHYAPPPQQPPAHPSQPPPSQYQRNYAPPQIAPDVLRYPPELRNFLIPYLPNPPVIAAQQRPHVTLTWAQGLDGRIASRHGVQTAISSQDTKAMTHFLRSAHDAILIGVRTAISDDPGLNCRLEGAGGYGGAPGQWQPRPIIIDPNGRLVIRPEMKILRVAQEGRARPPWVVVGPNANLHPQAVSTLKAFGGEFLMVNEIDNRGRFSWEGIFQILYREGIKSIMVEGGGLVLSDLLRKVHAPSVDSVIMTIAPTFLGASGVQVSQETEVDSHNVILQNRLRDVFWQALGREGDAVVCGRLEQPARGPPKSNGILQGIVEMAQADGANGDVRDQGHDRRDQQQQPPPQHHGQAQLPPMKQLPPPPQSNPHYQAQRGGPPQGSRYSNGSQSSSGDNGRRYSGPPPHAQQQQPPKSPYQQQQQHPKSPYAQPQPPPPARTYDERQQHLNPAPRQQP